jgi:TonB family protein
MTAERDFRRDLDLAIGSEYQILEELGRGGSSVVFHGRDLMLGREVAIKVIRGTQMDDAEAVTRFEREARVLARLQHPNIVMLYAAKQLSDGSLALVMQHASGWRTLKSVIRERGPFAPAAAERILIDVAAALDYLHEHHIVHRDIKPENVFVDADSGRAFVADFGIAKPGDGQASVTLTGVVIGTPAYMSPEQIDGIGVTGQSDIYSLGMVGYEMLTGRRPWAGENLYSVIFRQKTEKLPSLEELRPDVSERLRYAIEKATEKLPADRWADAAQLLAHFEGVQLAASPALLPAVVATGAEVHRWEPGFSSGLEIENSPTLDVAGALADVDFSEGAYAAAHAPWFLRRPREIGVIAAFVVLLGAGAAAVAMTRSQPDTLSVGPDEAVPFPMEQEIAAPIGDLAMESSVVEATPVSSASMVVEERPASPPPAAAPPPEERRAEATTTPAPPPVLAAAPAATAPTTGTATPDLDVLGAVAVPPLPATALRNSEPLVTADIREVTAAPRSTRGSSFNPRLQNATSFIQRLERIYASTSRVPGTRPDRRVMVLRVLVNERGEVLNTQVQTTSGIGYLDEAAVFASRLMQFSTAPDPNIPTQVWVTVPLSLEP